MKKGILTSVFMCFLAMTVVAQVRGVVKDAQGNVLVGANIVWKGTNLGTTTDAEGEFELQVQDAVNEMVTTYVGYMNDTTRWDGSAFVEITMKDGISLENVVVKASRPGLMKAKGAQNIDVISNTELVREKPLTSRYKGLLTATYKTPLEIWQFDLTLQINGGGRMPDHAPYGRFEAYPILNAQIIKWFRWGNIYLGGENLTNFKQKNPIIGCHDPWGSDFDATMIWGPVDGIMAYIGVKWKLTKD